MFVWLCLIAYVIALRMMFGRIRKSSNKITFLVMASIGTVLVLGSRYPHYRIEWDLNLYYQYYTAIQEIPWSDIFSFTKSVRSVAHFEPGYIILNKLVSSIIAWPQFLLFLEAAVCVGTTSYFIYQNTDCVFEGFLGYLLWNTFTFQLTGFRQALAMAICLIGTELIKKRKLLSFCITVFIAATFHKSAMLFLPAYFFAVKRLTPKQKIWIVGLSIPMVLFGDKLIVLLLDVFGYTYRISAAASSGIGTLVVYVFSVVLIFLCESDDRTTLSSNMTFAAFILFILHYRISVLERGVFYYSAGLFVALPQMIVSSRRIKNRALVYLLYFTLLFLLFGKTFISSDFIPYRFFWN